MVAVWTWQENLHWILILGKQILAASHSQPWHSPDWATSSSRSILQAWVERKQRVSGWWRGQHQKWQIDKGFLQQCVFWGSVSLLTSPHTILQRFLSWTECRTRQWEYYWEPSRTNSRSHAGNCQGQTHKVMLGTMKDKPTESYWEPWRTNPQSNTGNHQGQTHRAILGTIKDKPTQ